jgi:hypothetical protein
MHSDLNEEFACLLKRNRDHFEIPSRFAILQKKGEILN